MPAEDIIDDKVEVELLKYDPFRYPPHEFCHICAKKAFVPLATTYVVLREKLSASHDTLDDNE